VDEPVLLSTHGILAHGDLDDTQLLLEWCSAPQGACDGELINQEINVTWDGNEGTFPIDAEALNLSDGSYIFTYYLRDTVLRESPLVSLFVHVDHSDPIASLSAPLSVNESELLMIDGSDSRDGVWGNALQANWFITSPDGELRIAEQSETDGLVLSLYPEQAGIWSIKVDVVDMVGRRASQEITVLVENIIPESSFTINGLAGEQITNYTFIEGDEMILDGSSSIDTESDMATLTYRWTIDGTVSGDMPTIDLSELGTGTHEVELTVTDDDGTTSTKTILFSVEEKTIVDSKVLNYTAIIVFAILVLGLGLFTVKRLMENQSSSSMPKWHKSPDLSNDELDVDGSDTGMWADPISKGKD
ncbi:MAG: PKD domain-containing protein, partial [Candidatus Poseidoniaceae archaeon]|nr:PKD domain-containing protein [Candidatus Poseidoniaceae archaeon]